MKRCYFLIFSLFIATGLFAQNNELLKQLAAIEKSTTHNADIIELKKLLGSSNLTATENIAVQTVLVHKYQQLKQWDICLNYCQAQVALAHQKNNSLAEATFYKLIGGTYYYIPQKENAIAYWKKCIEIAEPNKYNALLAQCYHNVGVISLEEADYNLAEKYFIKAIDLSKQNNDTASTTFSLHYRLLATTYDAENKLDKAEKIFKEIIEKSRVAKDSANLVESLLFYTNVLKKKKEFEKAILFSQEALAITRKISLIDGVITALNTHAGNLADAENYKDAYKYKSEEDNLVRTRFSGDLNKKISDAEAVFKTTELQYENEIASIKAKKEKQVYITGFAGLLILASFASYYFYQRRSVRQKVQMQLQMQEEKERLSRDLHDNLGSQMALLSNNVESLDINYRKQTSIDENIDRVKGTSKQLLQTLRETIWILNKEQVTAEDFFDKLVEYAHRFLQSYPDIKLQVTENFSGSKQLNSNEALQLFRICQEAITNSSKYAGSKILELQGNTAQNMFMICIKDFGKGFDTKLIQEEGHYGLRNMQKRAASVNAALQIIAAAEKGTTITIEV
jgi:signal transduction histidine kinase